MKTYEIILVSLVLAVAIYAIGKLACWLYNRICKKTPTKADWEGWRKVERYLSLDDEEYYNELKDASYRAIDIMRDAMKEEE